MFALPKDFIQCMRDIYGCIPVVATDACDANNEEVAKRSIASLEFAGYALMTNVETIYRIFHLHQERG